MNAFIEGALVNGHAAAVLARLLRDDVRSGRLDGLPAQHRQPVLEAIAAIGLAAEAWRRAVDSSAASGNAETVSRVDGQHSSQAITIKEAATMLDLTERQVRNLAPSLGEKDQAGRWRLDPALVDAEANRRTA